MSAAVETATVGQVMQRQMVTVDVVETLSGLRDLFTRYRFQHVAVVEGERLVGVVSDHDLLKSLGPYAGRPWGGHCAEPTVRELVSRPLESLGREASLGDAAELLLRGGKSCVAVVDADGSLVGIVALRDLVRAAYAPSALTDQ